ncbi:MAG: coproporphyrinogen III oxidase/REP element-mobilizing transposase RayT [Paraglaciecola sp.]|jgi:coproporphyrinogen III oxidase/REP element-mobilizing transposase RayT
MKLEVLEKDNYYHIYNRGINGASIFESDENMLYFLTLVEKHLSQSIIILSYCLLKNHYHFLVKINCDGKVATQLFSNLFNAYAKAYNKQQNRTGSLFEKHFKRKKVVSNEYLRNLIVYIHRNPENHTIIDDFRKYNFSSYQEVISGNTGFVKINETIQAFDDLNNLIFVHNNNNNNKDLPGFENLAGHEPEAIDLEDSHKVLETLQEEKVSFKDKFYTYIENLQDTITSKIEAVDGSGKFEEDIWERPEGGGGRTRVIENGAIFEKGGVNISAVHGELPEVLRNQFKVKEGNFFACGLSLVLHPTNPFVPTVHANWRYFEMYDAVGNIVTQWFGGGQDLTPYYLFDEDATHFHTVCKSACDKHHSEFYSKFKKTCDDYFWNSHRNEARGIGGLFFDYLKQNEEFSIEDRFNFVTEVGDSFLESYVPIAEKRKEIPFTKAHKDWQEVRRGRYVEFNLVHDRGTLFGLKTNGRIESILMSLPPIVQWKYNHQPKENSEEARLLEVLMNPKDWVLA